MKRNLYISLLANLILGILSLANASEMVTVDNFVRAETDMTFGRYVKQGAFGKFLHIRQPTPIDKQDVVRMNRDTLYSVGFSTSQRRLPLLSRIPKGGSSR